MSTLLSKLLCLSLLALVVLPAWSVDLGDNFTVNGFYSLDASIADNNMGAVGTASRYRDYQQDSLNFENSLIGGQLSYNVTSKLDLMVQGAAFFRGDGSYTSSIDWAYLQYELGADTQLRAGKFPVPILQGIELRNVGLSRLWARPLVPDSGASGYIDYTGIEVIHRYSRGSHFWEFQVAAGEPDHELDEIDGDSLLLAAAAYQVGNFRLRSSIMYVEYSIDTRFGDVLTASGELIVGALESEWRRNRWLVNAGVSSGRAEFSPDDSMVYLSLGYEFPRWTPYIVGVRTKQHFARTGEGRPSGLRAMSVPGVMPGAMPVPGEMPVPMSPPLVKVGNVHRESLAVGLRWQLNDNHAIKFQLQRDERDDHTSPRRVSVDGNIFSVIVEGIF